jgi:hypothetical protein
VNVSSVLESLLELVPLTNSSNTINLDVILESPSSK